MLRKMKKQREKRMIEMSDVRTSSSIAEENETRKDSSRGNQPDFAVRTTRVSMVEALTTLSRIFPTWEKSSLLSVLHASSYNLHTAIDTLLQMEQDTYQSQRRLSFSHFSQISTTSGPSHAASRPPLHHVVLLPNDFLRVPGGWSMMEDVEPGAVLNGGEEEQIKSWLETKSGDTRENQASTAVEQQRSQLKYQCEDDESFQSFHSNNNTQRSIIDIAAAHERLRIEKNSPGNEYFTRASALFHKGVVNQDELLILRELILTTFKNEETVQSNPLYKSIYEFEWSLMILHCKGIRPAISLRMVGHGMVTPGILDPGYIEYNIRVLDVDTNSVWYVRRRYKEFYKFYKKILPLSKRVLECSFPSRKPGRANDAQLIQERFSGFQEFLRIVSSLVRPNPLSFLHGCVLRELQKFLHVDQRSENLQRLQSIRNKSIREPLRCYIYQILNDPTTTEGKSCQKFAIRMEENGINAETLHQTREFIEALKTHMKQTHTDFLEAYSEYLLDSPRKGYQLDQGRTVQEFVEDSICDEAEERVLVPMMHDLQTYLVGAFCREENELLSKMSALRGKPQSFFEIPTDKISLSSWKPVIDDLNRMDSALLPNEKLKILVSAANGIHSLYKNEQSFLQPNRYGGPHPSAPFESERDGNSIVALSGDDFLPIYIYAITHSNLRHPWVTRQVLSSLCDAEKRIGETGYYLASFEAAISYILNMDEHTGRLGSLSSIRSKGNMHAMVDQLKSTE